MSNALPLQGIRIADFSWVLAGPHCTKWLAALGAEVIKVESHYRPDRFRGVQPFINNTESLDGSVAWNMLNYSKRDCTINLGTADGRRLARELVDSCEVLIENFSTGVAERLGLAYDALSADHADLVMVSSSGLGRTGPDTGMRAFGKSIHGFTGHTWLTGWPSTPPRGIGGTWTDPTTGVTAVLAILAGVAYARRTGRGLHFDLSMAESTIALMAEPFLSYLATGVEPQPLGNAVPGVAPHNTYRCADGGWVAITVHDVDEWRALTRIAGLPDDGASLDSVQVRLSYRDAIDEAIDGWCDGIMRDDAVQRLREAGVCCAPVRAFDELLSDEHFQAREMMTELVQEGVGTYHIVKLPWLQTPAPPVRYTASPKLGQDNDYVFEQILGLSSKEIEELTATNVLI